MSELGVGFLMATATPMPQHGVVHLVVAPVLCFAKTQVETATNVVILHVGRGDPVRVIGHLLAGVATTVGTSAGAIRSRVSARTKAFGKTNLFVGVF